MRRTLFASLTLLLLLTGCADWLKVPASPTPRGPAYVIVTPDVNATATPTPFQPSGYMANPQGAEPTQGVNPSATPEPPTFTPTVTLTPTTTHTVSPDGVTPSLTPTVAPTLPAVTAVPGERTVYTLSATLDYMAHSMTVDEIINYTNHSGETLSSLVLGIEPNRWLGCLSIASVRVNDTPSAGLVVSGGWMEVPLTTPLANGEAVVLTIRYSLVFPWAGSTQVFGYDGWEINVVDWYPFVVPFVPGQGWVFHEPTTVGEHMVYDAADFDVTIQMTDPSLGVVIAASAPAAGNRYQLRGARNFVFSASPKFQTTTTTVGAVTITSYYFPSEYIAGAAILEKIALAVGTFNDRFAPYPYTSLSIVEAWFPDGMEYSGLFFLSRDFYLAYDGGTLNSLVTVGVHEAAHNWWYGLVGSDQAMQPWLDEAMAIYSERVFYEVNAPNLVDNWWNFRVNSFNPSGWVDATIYNGGAFRPYTNAVYLRGGLFLEEIRVRIGDEAFNAFLRDYAAQMAFKRATTADFFTLLRQHTSVDFSDITARYFSVAP